MEKISRTAREIKVGRDLIANKNIFVKIGTSENRDSPQTVYLDISFWVEIKDKKINGNLLRAKLEKHLHDIYNTNLKLKLTNNTFFPYSKDNIFVTNIPTNVNYNDKKNFVSIELYLHTLNIASDKKFPLNNKKNTELFYEMVDIVNTIGEADILNNKFEFNIHQKVKRK